MRIFYEKNKEFGVVVYARRVMKHYISKYVPAFLCITALFFISCATGNEQLLQESEISQEAVTFSVSGGTVDNGTRVMLTTQTPGATIFYTIDGSTPTVMSKKYTAPLIISGNANDIITVKAVAHCPGYMDSPVATVSYTVSEYVGAIYEYGENTALYLGNPSSARNDVSLPENYLIEHVQYSLSYNSSTLIPNWVAWHLCMENIGHVPRKNKFKPDALIPVLWYRVKANDYQAKVYGFDRGHMCPSGDRTDTEENNHATFYMSNMVPQSPSNNQQVWKSFEDYIRGIVKGSPKYEAYIVCGPYGRGGSSRKMNSVMTILTKTGKEITVPAYTWKAVIFIEEGIGDIERIDESALVKAVFVPNDETCRGKKWYDYQCSIDYIEEKTGFDLFSRIPDEIEAIIEARVD